MIENYQNHILKPSEMVDYANEIIHTVKPETIQMEPMTGFKVLMQDTNAYRTPQAIRFQEIESKLGFLKNTGCLIRETPMEQSTDGFWVISFPVPVSMLATQVTNITKVIDILVQYFGIVPSNIVEINVSGKCRDGELEWRMRNVNIPQTTRQNLIEPNDTMYRLGHIARINEEFAMLRTMWDWRQTGSTISAHTSDLIVIPQLIAGMFR